MRKRRPKSILRWVFPIVGVSLVIGAAIAALPSLSRQGWVDPSWGLWAEDLAKQIVERLALSEGQINRLLWLGGIGGSLIGGAFTLLASWHFAEMNLPRRLEDLKKTHERAFATIRPHYLALARRGLGTIPADIEASRLTYMRSWSSFLGLTSEKERVRVLAASANQALRESMALTSAVHEAQQRSITALLIRGYQYGADGENDLALEQFEAAIRVDENDVLSRDIAAGWARKLGKLDRERDLLKSIHDAASRRPGMQLEQACALRRTAELLDKQQNENDWRLARVTLDKAQKLLSPLAAQGSVKKELVRVLTLLCEVQCARLKIGRLDGTLTRLGTLAADMGSLTRPEEQEGEIYGEDRVAAVQRRVTELRGDDDASDDEEVGPLDTPSPSDNPTENHS